MSAREQRAVQAVKELRRYNKLKIRVKSLQDRMEMIDSEMHGIKSSIGGDSVKSGSGDNRLDSLIDQKQKVQEDISACMSQITITERAIDALSHDERICLQRFFLDGMRANDATSALCEQLSMDASSVWRLRRQSLEDYAVLAGIIA